MRYTKLSLPGLVLVGVLAGCGPRIADTPAAAIDPDPDWAARCAALEGMEISASLIERAEYVEEGTSLAPLNLPARDAFCQVRATVSPAPASKISVEVWLPRRWNEKLLGLGGSGLSGGLVLAPLTFPDPVGNGYAVMATDAGHENTERASWAYRQPERIVDYGYRATMLGTEISKALIISYYGEPARRAYFQGCSNGGRDALMLAQRLPDAYDGIIAGAPANNFVSLMTAFADYRSQIEKLPPDSLSPKVMMLHRAVLEACDAADGLKDGIVSDPRACKFDPFELICNQGQDINACLSREEADVVQALYEGSRTGDGEVLHPGLPPGSEYLWKEWWTRPVSTGGASAPDFFGYFVYDDPDWTMDSFHIDQDFAAATKKLGSILDATDTDLTAFARSGGKLLIYHGWDDQAVSPSSTIGYFEDVHRNLGPLSESVQLFMVPGMGHCFDGKGLTTADFVGELDRWVDSGAAPDQIIAEKPVNFLLSVAGLSGPPLMTRPVCAWPQAAHYKGEGSGNDAGDFICK